MLLIFNQMYRYVRRLYYGDNTYINTVMYICHQLSIHCYYYLSTCTSVQEAYEDYSNETNHITVDIDNVQDAYNTSNTSMDKLTRAIKSEYEDLNKNIRSIYDTNIPSTDNINWFGAVDGNLIAYEAIMNARIEERNMICEHFGYKTPSKAGKAITLLIYTTPINFIEDSNKVSYKDNNSLLKIDQLHSYMSTRTGHVLEVESATDIKSVMMSLRRYYKYQLTKDIYSNHVLDSYINTYLQTRSQSSLNELKQHYLKEYYRLYYKILQVTNHRLGQLDTPYTLDELGYIPCVDKHHILLNDWLEHYNEDHNNLLTFMSPL